MRDGFHWSQAFEYGEPHSQAEEGARRPQRTGTQVIFWPDPEVFSESVEFSAKTVISSRLREMAFLNRGVEIRFHDERGEEPWRSRSNTTADWSTS